MTQDASATTALPPHLSRRAATAGVLGTLIEYFEFLSYGYLTVFIAPQFFPNQSQAAAVLSGLLVFASGYLVRPLGAIFFGWVGDRNGRRTALVATVFLMGAASFLMGVLPTYAAVGVLAPVLLVIVRLLQGFSAGGELMGAVTYMAESAPKGKRGFYVALSQIGSNTGIGLAGIAAGILVLSVSTEAMGAWGWRMPFLLCLPLTILTLWVRLKIEDTPEFKEMVDNSEITKVPVLEALRAHPANVARTIGFLLVVNVINAVGTTYLTIHLITDLHVPSAQVFLLAGGMQVFSLAAMYWSGKLNDRIGMRRVLVIGLALSLVVAVPLFLLVDATPSLLVMAVLFAVWQIAIAFQSPPIVGMVVEMFPRNVRYTAAAFGTQIGVIIGAGLTPYASQLFVTVTGNSLGPAYLVVAASVLGFLVLATMRGKKLSFIPDGQEPHRTAQASVALGDPS